MLTSLYQEDDSTITAKWDVTDTEGAFERVYYTVGTYPSSSDIINATQTDLNYIPFGVVEPNVEGKTTIHMHTYFRIIKE